MQNVLDLGIETNADKISELVENVASHDYNLGVLITYKKLNELDEQGFVDVYEDGFSLRINKRKTEFYFVQQVSEERFHNIRNKGYRVVTLDKVEGVEGTVKRTEIVYELSKVFKKESYPNKKKRYQRIVYPFKKINDLGVTIKEIDSEHHGDVKRVHDSWIKRKLNNEKVHQNTLPTQRYLRAYELGLSVPQIKTFGAFNNEGELFSFRTVSFKDDRCYDLSFVTDEKIDSQINEYLNTVFLRKLYDEGIKTFNTGLSEGSLKRFKKHLPHFEIHTYQYKMVK